MSLIVLKKWEILARTGAPAAAVRAVTVLRHLISINYLTKFEARSCAPCLSAALVRHQPLHVPSVRPYVPAPARSKESLNK